MQPGLFALLPQVVDAVSVPVIAAGGVADGRTVAAAFVLGASAVQMGTAFLRCEEANVLDAHRAALREANDACTVVTDMITGRPARFIRNRLIDDLVASGLEPVAFPAQLSLTAPLGGTGDRELTALFAGQSAALARDTTAAELVADAGAGDDRAAAGVCALACVTARQGATPVNPRRIHPSHARKLARWRHTRLAWNATPLPAAIRGAGRACRAAAATFTNRPVCLTWQVKNPLCRRALTSGAVPRLLRDTDPHWPSHLAVWHLKE